MFRVEKRSGVRSRIGDDDGDEGRGGHWLSSFSASLNGGVTFTVVQVH